MLLAELACAPGVAAPDADALLLPDGRWSRAELGDAVTAMVGPLATLAPLGGYIAVAADNRPEVLALLLAIPAAGRVAAPIDTRLVPDEMVAQLDAAGAQAVIGTAEALGRLAPVLAHAPAGRTFVGLDAGAGDISLNALVAAPAPAAPVATSDDVPAWRLFSNGSGPATAGRSVTARHLGDAVATLDREHPLAANDVSLLPLPLGHAAVVHLLHALHRGRPVVLPSRFDTGAIVEMAARYGATRLVVAPTMLRALLDHRASAADPGTVLAGLRNITCTTAAAPTLLAEARALGADVHVVDALGLIPDGEPDDDR